MKRVYHFHSILLIICILLSVSCEKKKDNNIDSSLDLLTDKGYSPLQVGNYWHLSYLPERRIDTTEEIEGVAYYRMLSDQDTLYYRKSENGKIFRRTKDSDEIVKFDLSAEVGETWTYSSSNSGMVWYGMPP